VPNRSSIAEEKSNLRSDNARLRKLGRIHKITQEEKTGLEKYETPMLDPELIPTSVQGSLNYFERNLNNIYMKERKGLVRGWWK
jgi:hypothetical protein